MSFLKRLLQQGKPAPISNSERLSEYEEAVFNVFNSENGRFILNTFIHGTFDKTNSMPLDSMNAEILAFREGRLSVIREFIATVDKVSRQSITGDRKL